MPKKRGKYLRRLNWMPPNMYRRGKSNVVRRRKGRRDAWIVVPDDKDEALAEYDRIMGIKPNKRYSGQQPVGDVFGRWCKTVEAGNKRDDNAAQIIGRAKRYWLPLIADIKCCELCEDDLDDAKAEIIKAARKAGRKDSLSRRLCKEMLRFARWGEGRLFQPAIRPKNISDWLPSCDEVIPDHLSDHEIGLLALLDPKHNWVCRLGLATGLRWEELCGIRRQHVVRTSDGGQAIYQLRVPITKNGKFRTVPLPNDILEDLLKSGERPVPYSPLSRGSFARDVRNQVNRALEAQSGNRPGFESKFTVHRLRHTFAYNWLRYGGRIEKLRIILGHGSQRVTERYAKLRGDDVQREARRVFEAMHRAQLVANTVATETQVVDQ